MPRAASAAACGSASAWWAEGALRARSKPCASELPPDVYLWVNAYKREPDYYTASMVEELTRIDPLFPHQQPFATRVGANRAGPAAASSRWTATVRSAAAISSVS